MLNSVQLYCVLVLCYEFIAYNIYVHYLSYNVILMSFFLISSATTALFYIDFFKFKFSSTYLDDFARIFRSFKVVALRI